MNPQISPTTLSNLFQTRKHARALNTSWGGSITLASAISNTQTEPTLDDRVATRFRDPVSNQLDGDPSENQNHCSPSTPRCCQRGRAETSYDHQFRSDLCPRNIKGAERPS